MQPALSVEALYALTRADAQIAAASFSFEYYAVFSKQFSMVGDAYVKAESAESSLEVSNETVLEDMAYFCMDFRQDLGKPYQPPYPPTVARYTDNYIIMLSSSKIFSYAGQRMALACISDKLFANYYHALAERYDDSGIFGHTFIASILYMIKSGFTASTQYVYADM